MSLITSIVLATMLPTSVDIPDLKADFSPAPVQALLGIVNQVLAFGTLVALVAVIAIAMALAFAGLDARQKSKTWIALGIAGAAMAVMGSATGFLTFFAKIPLF